MEFKKLGKSLAVLSFTAIALLQLGMHQTGAQHLIVRLALSNYPAQMKQLHQLDFDIAGVSLPHQTVDLVVSPLEIKQLHALGFQFMQMKSTVEQASPDAQYQTPASIAALLQKYASTYPNLAQVMSMGKSLEGRDIWAIKITSNVTHPDAAKPRIFFNGMHHAREVMAVEIPLDTIDTLLTQYGKDPKVTHWVDANEIWVMPMFNVDGNQKVWSSDNMWRKNTRGGYGVDINRNYPFQWNFCNGSSDRQGAQDYHGPSGGSEPETQVMMSLIQKVRPVFNISYHSYSEIVIYPYGCENEHTPTKEVVEGIGQEIAGKIVADDLRSRYAAGTAPELLYAVDGSDIDWMYHEYSVIPYVIEVNSADQGFQPSYSAWRDQTVNRLKPAWETLLDKLDGSSIHGQVKNAAGVGVAKAVLHIARVSGGAAFVQDFPARDDGYYDVILPPGKYTVSTAAPGITSQSQTVTVGNSRVEL
jgi:carboxypeptidase T